MYGGINDRLLEKGPGAIHQEGRHAQSSVLKQYSNFLRTYGRRHHRRHHHHHGPCVPKWGTGPQDIRYEISKLNPPFYIVFHGLTKKNSFRGT